VVRTAADCRTASTAGRPRSAVRAVAVPALSSLEPGGRKPENDGLHPDPENVNPVTQGLLAAGLSLAALAAIAQPVRSAGAEPDAAQVMLSEGTTMLVRGTSFSTPVRREVPIRSGDRIRTGPDGRVQLRFADGALMSIQPGSDFRIEAYAFDAVRQRSFFELMQGSVRAVSGSIGRRDRDDYRLKTPTATIGIRGTEFTVDEALCPSTGCVAGTTAGLTVTVIAGRVSVTNEAGSIEVPAGVTLRVRDARTAPALPSAPPRRRPAAGGGAGAGAGAKPLNAPMSSDDLGGGAR
jgi:hypothetical protein